MPVRNGCRYTWLHTRTFKQKKIARFAQRQARRYGREKRGLVASTTKAISFEEAHPESQEYLPAPLPPIIVDADGFID